LQIYETSSSALEAYDRKEPIYDDKNIAVTISELRAESENVRFEVFTAVTKKNGVFWDVTLCGSCKNRRFGGT
jgi:hypothetical protein